MKTEVRKGLIVAALCASFVSFSAKTHAQHGLLREVYNNITGGLTGLQNNANFPGNPALSEIITEFEVPANFANNYGQRVRGYIEPPETGDYVFWISSDDQSELYLSSNDQPVNRRKIAEVLVNTGQRVWNQEGGQQSGPITLQKGERYYIEAIMVEGTGNDHLAVRWRLPDGTIEEPIPNARLVVELIPPQISRQPQNVTVNEGEDAIFSIQYANRAPVTVQWFRNDVAISGATNTTLILPAVRIADNGSRIVARATNLFATNFVSSAVAFLNVRRDTTAPTIIAAQTGGENDLISINFSEALDPASVAALSNFEILGGPRVLAANLDQSGTTLILRTTPLAFGEAYTLILNNVRDRADQPNAIEPDSTVDFSFGYTALSPELVFGRPEKPGPSTRRTGLTISEIMYHPAPRTDGRNIEFVEIYNSQESIESVGGYRISGAIDFTFPNGTFIPARGYIVVAAAPVDLQVLYGVSRVVGPFTNALPDSGTLRLLNSQGAVLLAVDYDAQGLWPVAPDGGGHSLVLSRPSYGENDPRAWSASQFIEGSPGRQENSAADPFAGLVINEFLANTDLPLLDFVELYNYSDHAMDLSDLYLSDDIETNKFQIAKGTSLPPLGFIRFDQNQLGFALSSAGEKILLRHSSRTRLIDAVRFGPQPTGVALGRFPDGSPGFRQLAQPTPGTANTRPRLPDVVINEIMYNPVSGDQEEEYLELFNRSGQPVNLRGWRLQDGISFTFPQDLVLPAGGFIVLAKNIDLVRSNYVSLNAANSIGNFNGNLANGGERIVLERPEALLVIENGRTTTNIAYMLVDEVDYGTGGRWPHWADGGGSSMELIDVNSDNDEASNWAASDETGKSQWVTIERRGLLSWGSTNFIPTSPSRFLHVILMDEGEALLDNVQVFRDGGANLVSNPGFEQALRDWTVGGTHESSAPEARATGGTALHIRAAARGDTAANRIRARLSTGLTNGEIVTIKADMRWLRGTPDVLLRLHGNYLELAGTLPLPKNLGSPGVANGRQTANAGPSIEQVQHTPVLPAANQQVSVIARIDDPDRIALAMLNYRVDAITNSNTNYIRLPMSYNGAGLYSATIPGQIAGVAASFFIEALDARGSLSRFPADAPVQTGVILFGDGSRAGNLGTYRLWLTRTNISRWTLRERSSNKPLDATFVYNNERIIYNMGTLYSGSPFHWFNYNGPLGNGANYLMVMPDDDLFLGQTDFVLNLPSNIASDNTGVREQTFFWMANQVNQPVAHRRFMHLFLNGVNRGAQSVFEDSQQPSRDFIEQWYPNDPDGELYKFEDWFEYNDGVTERFNLDARLNAFYTPNLTNNAPELAKELYRWWTRKRAVNGSTHDYSELFRLVEAVNTPDTEEFIARVEALIDVDEWMGAIAIRHAVGDWDAFGYSRGKNMYAYKPTNGKWQLLHWDIAFAFGLGDGPTTDIFDVFYFDGTQDTITKRMMDTPIFRRAYLRALHEIANGPMVASIVNPVIDAKFQGLVANGVPVSPPETVKSWIAQRRDYILAQVAGVSSGFGITLNNGNNFTTNRNTLALTGTAPVNVQKIKVNGLDYPIEWTSINTWRTRLALQREPAQNVIRIEGFDSRGALIPEATAAITVTLTGATEPIAGKIIINEILADPAAPQTEFVELHNIARLTSYDLSGYRLNGLGFTFPAGSVIAPGGFLVVARDALAFAERFGFTLPVAGVFTGAVDDQGETLSLIAPALPGSTEVVLASVRIDGMAPWPMLVNGASLQLIDPLQDISRVANWTSIPGGSTPGTTNSVRSTLVPFPLLWVNEVQPQNSSGLADSAGDRDPWVEIYNSSAASISLAGLFLTDDYNSLTKWGFPSGASLAAGQRAMVWLDGEPGENTGAEWHANFRLAGTSSSIALVGTQRGLPAVFDYLRFEQVPAGQSFGAFPDGQAVRRETFFKATPGAANDLSAGPVRVLINEWMAANSTTIQDPDDLDFDDWFELYNAGAQSADLGGFSLTDDLANPRKFTIPSGTAIPAGGYLLVWADEENADNGQLHVNFRLSTTGELIALLAPDGATIDSVTFGGQATDISQGRNPDGGSQIASFNSPTPGASNSGVDPSALRFTAIAVSAGQFTLTWNSEQEVAYRVEYKNSLNDTSWTLLRSVTATGVITSTADPLGASHRFYRVSRQ